VCCELHFPFKPFHINTSTSIALYNLFYKCRTGFLFILNNFSHLLNEKESPAEHVHYASSVFSTLVPKFSPFPKQLMALSSFPKSQLKVEMPLTQEHKIRREKETFPESLSKLESRERWIFEISPC